MTTYRVRWGIDVDAETPEGAARTALAIQRDPESTAVVFSVEEHLTCNCPDKKHRTTVWSNYDLSDE